MMQANVNTRSFRLPDELFISLSSEAKSQERDATKQLIHILRERYKKQLTKKAIKLR